MNTSQNFEAYVPIYDAIPEDWEEARGFITEQFVKMANGINQRQLGYYVDEEQLAGILMIPSSTNPFGTQAPYRDVFVKVIDCSPLVAGANSFAHGITVDSNFTLYNMYVAATASATPSAQIITDANVTIDATNINITSPGAFDRAYATVLYMLEV